MNRQMQMYTVRRNSMKNRKIVADTSCDLFTLAGTAFACAPMKISTAER